jgi:hypothetical protein
MRKNILEKCGILCVYDADFFKWKERAKEILHVPFCLVLFGAEDLGGLNHVSQGGFGFGPRWCRLLQ